MKIDYIITGMDIGGAEIQVVNLLLELKKRGHTVRLISITPPIDLTERLLNANIPVISLAMRHKIILPIALIKLAMIVKKHSPDIIHSHMFHANIMARLLRLCLLSRQVPIICTAHSTYEGGRLRDYVYRITNRLCDLNTVVSEAVYYRFIHKNILPPQKTMTVYNSINTELFDIAIKPIKKEFRWLSVGRLVKVKNQQLILQAIKNLPRSKLTIIGDGKEYISLQTYIDNHQLNDRVTLAGKKWSLIDDYQQADGFVLTSNYEGFALVIAEAMACGLLVVTTNCGGPTEIIGRDSPFGEIVALNDINELTAAMRRIERLDIKRRHELGYQARKRVIDNFSLNKIASQWEDIYQCLNRNRL